MKKSFLPFVYIRANKKNISKLISGFTLIELLVVISIIGTLATVVLASLNTARAKARDARRLSDMHQMQLALDVYYLNNGYYPTSDNLGCGGWDTSGPGGIETIGTFITPLVNGGYLPQHFKDPTTNTDCGNYQYYRYGPMAGCPNNFYVLGIADMETSDGTYPKSPGWSCDESDWQPDMEWVTGKSE